LCLRHVLGQDSAVDNSRHRFAPVGHAPRIPLIDCEVDTALKAVLVGMFEEG
jgi:hypothetical protein